MPASTLVRVPHHQHGRPQVQAGYINISHATEVLGLARLAAPPHAYRTSGADDADGPIRRRLDWRNRSGTAMPIRW